jgi:hypothetical protein
MILYAFKNVKRTYTATGNGTDDTDALRELLIEERRASRPATDANTCLFG